MKLELGKVSVAPAMASTGVIPRTQEEKGAYMRSFFAQEENTVLVKVGKFLANTVGADTLASLIASGEAIELPTRLDFDGVSLELAADQIIGLSKEEKEPWLCPSCKSAHGSNIGPSKSRKGINVRVLAENEFYYSPVSKKLFTISVSCFDNWVKAQGLAGQIMTLASYKASLTVAEPSKKGAKA
jgi:hypothetical protein